MKKDSTRFWSRVDQTEACWVWNGSINGKGYGQIFIDGQNHMAHRYSWLMHKGPIPKGLFILHKCDNRRCVNPDHLFSGTHTENMNDMVAKKRQAKGDKVSGSKLNAEQVKMIRQMRESKMKYKDIAAVFGMSTYHIRDVCRGRYWNHAI